MYTLYSYIRPLLIFFIRRYVRLQSLIFRPAVTSSNGSTPLLVSDFYFPTGSKVSSKWLHIIRTLASSIQWELNSVSAALHLYLFSKTKIALCVTKWVLAEINFEQMTSYQLRAVIYSRLNLRYRLINQSIDSTWLHETRQKNNI